MFWVFRGRRQSRQEPTQSLQIVITSLLTTFPPHGDNLFIAQLFSFPPQNIPAEPIATLFHNTNNMSLKKYANTCNHVWSSHHRHHVRLVGRSDVFDRWLASLVYVFEWVVSHLYFRLVQPVDRIFSLLVLRIANSVFVDCWHGTVVGCCAWDHHTGVREIHGTVILFCHAKSFACLIGV